MTQLDKFRNLLQELFQLDQADLDFGIYRIMNQKRDEVVRFLDKDLLPQVKAAFSHYQSADKATVQTELDKLADSIRHAGMQPDDSPKYQQLRQKLAASSVDIVALEGEVFSHLYSFFRRYYSEGDFLSLRRYKAGVYAIPYEGEEVKLHWANADQYYVKSSETFRDYTFKVPLAPAKKSASRAASAPGVLTEGRVRFQIVAASTEQDNNKPAAGKERRFVLCDPPLAIEDGDLAIRLEYRSAEGKTKQDELNRQAIESILASRGQSAELDSWIDALATLAPTEKKKDRTVLEKHLTQFSARNTFDYFIHKDLGGFLRRELDFYIKNEVMHLDDIEHESAPKVEQYLSQIKVIRSIAHKIIQFLEQLENFQKKLWLKKKFVIETNYCITLDRVPEELYPEIAANDAQREEWVRLFAIDEIKKDLNGPGYSVPLKIGFLKENPSLVLDTCHFSSEFKSEVLASQSDIDACCNGVLLHGDSFHALTLIIAKHSDKVSCVYIDPPYNTGNDGFTYRDSYQHSSWLSMIENRVSIASRLMTTNSSMWVSIDDHELPRLTVALADLFGESNCIANVIWQKVFSPKNTAQYFSDDHEYISVWAKDKAVWRPTLLPRSADAESRYTNPDNDPRGPWSSSDMTARNYYSEGEYEVRSHSGKAFRPTIGSYWRVNKERFAELDRDNRIWWGESRDNMPRMKRFLTEVKQGVVPQTLWLHEDVGHTQDAKRELLATVRFDRTSDVLNTVKPTDLVRRAILIGTGRDQSSIVLDFFAGSGTTAHAVLKQNAEDGGNRKFILVEMGSYFDAMTKQRAVRALYSPEWRDSRPASDARGSGVIKYIRLESYADALNNLELSRSKQQAQLLDKNPDLREQYVLSYMLDVESRGSQSLLNIEAFRNPDEYKLKVERNGETQLVNVDLVETFNWLLGLTVKHIDVIPFKKGDPGVRVVEGTSPTGDRVLVLWRNIDHLDNNALDKWFDKQGYSSRDLEYDLIYVNGDNNLENLRRTDQTWKVRLIEGEFQRLMFDVSDV